MSDPRQKLGIPRPTDPITGKEKRTEPESIIEFAQRHGWEVRCSYRDNGSEDWRFVKDLAVVDLWASRRGRHVSLATIGGVDLPQTHGFPVRERVEMFLTGVPCSCERHEGLYSYEETPNPDCLIHGTSEPPEAADARGIDVNQAVAERH